MRRTPDGTRLVIIQVVIELIESNGYDAVRVREVARRAHVSLDTLYKHFDTRDELIRSAVDHWMTETVYKQVATPRPGTTLYDGLMDVMEAVFEPWEREPLMLEAFHRARTGRGGALEQHAMNAMAHVHEGLTQGVDAEYLRDVHEVIGNVLYALIGRFAHGDIAVTDILPVFERTVYRLTVQEQDTTVRRRRPGMSRNEDATLQTTPDHHPSP
jgi:TetR/AcrR family transcriptional regulator, cholesterol catabolism regulator